MNSGGVSPRTLSVIQAESNWMMLGRGLVFGRRVASHSMCVALTIEITATCAKDTANNQVR